MFFIGLDLGQKRDHSAIVLVERPQVHAYLTRPEKTLLVRLAERAPLGTSFAEIVDMTGYVAGVANQLMYQGGRRTQCCLAVDATGLGQPVVEMLRRASTGWVNGGCQITAVTITGGDRQNTRSGEGGAMNVPKQDLIAGLQVALERRTLRFPAKMRESGTLKRELLDVRMMRRESGSVRFGAEGKGQHDDLVIALALAVWRAGRW